MLICILFRNLKKILKNKILTMEYVLFVNSIPIIKNGTIPLKNKFTCEYQVAE